MSIGQEILSVLNETIKTSSVFSDPCTEDSWMSSVYFDLPSQFLNSNYQTWLMSVMGSVLVGLSGIVPLFIIPVDNTATLKNGTGAKTLRVLLSFAVGGLLGDVFLHLLPEAWENQHLHSVAVKGGHHSLHSGLWVLTGLLAFIIIEKVFSFEKDEEEEKDEEKEEILAEANKTNKSFPIRRKKSSFILNDLTVNFVSKTEESDAYDTSVVDNNNTEEPKKVPQLVKKATNNIRVSGYLNLMANSIDNFTHGLAVGGSFMLSTRVGVFTTFAILVHEIPHEVGDFAILLRAGFSRWDAACAQIYTAFAGVLGALTALMFNASATAVEARTSWILPFTAGGFLHIALVTVLPELLDEKNPKESLKQMCSLASGITVMAVLTALVEG